MQAFEGKWKITQHVVSHLMYITSVDDTMYLRIQFLYGCPCAEKSVILYEHMTDVTFVLALKM